MFLVVSLRGLWLGIFGRGDATLWLQRARAGSILTACNFGRSLYIDSGAAVTNHVDAPGGALEIVARPGQGMTLMISIPLSMRV